MDIIKFSEEKTQLDKDKEAIEAHLLAMDEYLKLSAMKLNDSLDFFWSLSDERICALLNHYGIEKVTGIFTSHAEKAGMMNTLLTTRGIEPIAKIGAKRELQVDPDTGVISLKPIVPLAPPEELTPLTEPSPDPIPVDFAGQPEPNVNN